MAGKPPGIQGKFVMTCVKSEGGEVTFKANVAEYFVAGKDYSFDNATELPHGGGASEPRGGDVPPAGDEPA